MDLRAWALFGLALLLPALAHAQDKPSFLPTKDVIVTYRVSGGDMGNGAQKLQVIYTAHGQRERIEYFRWAESKYPFGALIYDRPANKVIAIDGDKRVFVERSTADVKAPEARYTGPGMHYTRKGTATVANQPCTEWELQTADKNDPGGTMCIMDDGLILRTTRAGASEPTMIAVSVVYSTSPDSVFSPPADFTRLPSPSN